jgi:hypothetical protein
MTGERCRERRRLVVRAHPPGEVSCHDTASSEQYAVPPYGNWHASGDVAFAGRGTFEFERDEFPTDIADGHRQARTERNRSDGQGRRQHDEPLDLLPRHLPDQGRGSVVSRWPLGGGDFTLDCDEVSVATHGVLFVDRDHVAGLGQRIRRSVPPARTGHNPCRYCHNDESLTPMIAAIYAARTIVAILLFALARRVG